MTKPIIKCSNWNLPEEQAKDFKFMSYFYLHCEAENINNYDCIEGNIDAFSKAMKGCINVVNLLMENGDKLDAILIPYYDKFHRGMQGLVCLCKDEIGFNHAINDYIGEGCILSLSLYEDDKVFLKEKYPEIYKIIKNKRS